MSRLLHDRSTRAGNLFRTSALGQDFSILDDSRRNVHTGMQSTGGATGNGNSSSTAEERVLPGHRQTDR